MLEMIAEKPQVQNIFYHLEFAWWWLSACVLNSRPAGQTWSTNSIEVAPSQPILRDTLI